MQAREGVYVVETDGEDVAWGEEVGSLVQNPVRSAAEKGKGEKLDGHGGEDVCEGAWRGDGGENGGHVEDEG